MLLAVCRLGAVAVEIAIAWIAFRVVIGTATDLVVAVGTAVSAAAVAVVGTFGATAEENSRHGLVVEALVVEALIV